MKMLIAATLGVTAFACCPALGAEMSKQEYRDAKKRIDSEYYAERQKCGVGYGHAYELCLRRAHGMRDVAKAELEAKYKPSPRHYYDAAIARAKSAYAIAGKECEDKRGEDRKACKAEAKIAYDRARGEARSELKVDRSQEASKAAR